MVNADGSLFTTKVNRHDQIIRTICGRCERAAAKQEKLDKGPC